MKRIVLLMLPLTACATPVVTVQPNSCSSLLPEEWSKGVEGAPLPPDNATIGDWIVFGDAQTGRLDVANDRTKSAIGIISRCEERDAKAVRRSTSFFGRLFG